jgi:hypothetical protein
MKKHLSQDLKDLISESDGDWCLTDDGINILSEI